MENYVEYYSIESIACLSSFVYIIEWFPIIVCLKYLWEGLFAQRLFITFRLIGASAFHSEEISSNIFYELYEILFVVPFINSSS